MRLTVLLAFLFPWFCSALAPGKALILAGNGQYVNFGEVLGGVRTISFWIKPSLPINSSNAAELPILVRDSDGPAMYSAGEVALYFGKTGSSDAGKLVFIRGVEATQHKIVSDSASWMANRWYHVAAIIHEQNGMQLYINGVLQQDVSSDTSQIYMRTTGNTGPLFLGHWGAMTTYGINAQFDELRFYDYGQSELEVRSQMCKEEIATNLKGYFKFDAATPLYIPTTSGTITGQGVGLSSLSIVNSNAPVGTESVFLYNFNSSSSISFTKQATFTVDNMNSPAVAVHLYSTPDGSLYQPGFVPFFFGVWFSSPNAQYRTQMDFSSLSNSCDSCSEIRSRDHQTAGVWLDRQLFADTCVFTLPNESPGLQSYREEYIVKPRITLSGGLPDTIVACDSSKVQLTAATYPGARYLWDDGSTKRSRIVDRAGLYIVTIKWHGCEVKDSSQLIYQYRPYFNLPQDTAICVGDTLVLIAPLDIDSATYNWGRGLQYGRTFRMYYAGTISLMITVGNCSWEDEITVSIIRPFQLELGKDTTLCIGEELILGTPNGVNVLWNDGSTGRQRRIFNQTEKVWVKAWNPCFEKTDTIRITYEDCECYFYIANSFTPNNDGINDVFVPITECIYENYSLMIFDRWGKKIFQTENQKQGWDGYFDGEKANLGVYSYILEYNKFEGFGSSKSQHGTLTLLE